jgi:hypothetical protein
MNDSIEKSVNTIQSEMFDIRENITDGPNLIINNPLLNIHKKNREKNVELEEHENLFNLTIMDLYKNH